MIRVLFLALALTACSPTGRDPQANESAALDMIRMGYVQWVATCAWQHGRNRALLATAIRRCQIDLGLRRTCRPVPHHRPERCAP
jgi:hypothetical protein